MQSLRTVTATTATALRSDWGPAIRQAVTLAATACAMVYALGYVSGAWVHRTNDRLAQLVAHHGEAVEHLGPIPELPPLPAAEPASEPQSLGSEPIESGVEPWHVLTDQEAARLLVANGASRRLAARTLGVSDRTVRRWLREAA